MGWSDNTGPPIAIDHRMRHLLGLEGPEMRCPNSPDPERQRNP